MIIVPAHQFIICVLLLGLTGCSYNQPEALYVQPTSGAKFWIGDTGPTGPIFSGKQQYPFVCTSYREGLGQPLIDNQDGIGNAVFRETIFGPWIYGKPIGYSRNCSIKTQVEYYYFSTKKQEFLPLKTQIKVPANVERITINGEETNFVVRVERGTINRFFYSIAMLAPYTESLTSPETLNNTAWNSKLVYKFRGGVGIGHWQGRARMDKSHALHYASLKRGYAVAFSSGTSTATHYNLQLAAETAIMLKQHVVVTYGKPEYTVGIGGSGGAIQQYIIAQNNHGFLDGAIPQLSYPDMVTQISYVADCDLLERYFDHKYQAEPDSKWGDWLFRAKIAGLNANTTALNSAKLDNPFAPRPGASTCSRSWRGQVQTVMNPHLTHPAYQKALDLFRYPDEVKQNIKWTHWNDLANIYPQDEHGIAKSTWDNTGVQYGLQALRDGDLNVDEFLELNACVGSWKPPHEMVPGKYPWNPLADPELMDPWDQSNMQLNNACRNGTPAPRGHASSDAIKAALESGHVFTGRINIPIIDVRWYLDPALDIHHSFGSFSTRARIINHNGSAKQHVIWVAECDEINAKTLERHCSYDPSGDALDVMEQWLTRRKPEQAVDSCFDAEGKTIYSGHDAWDGILNNKPKGPCTREFPVYPTARMIAGEEISGDTLQCRFKSIDRAFGDGDYGAIRFSTQQLNRLNQIFPEGVCAY